MEEEAFMDLRQKIRKGDLELLSSAGIIVSSQMGSLLALRENLESNGGVKLVYFSLSNDPWYLVHWNDLSKEKQKQLGSRQR